MTVEVIPAKATATLYVFPCLCSRLNISETVITLLLKE